MKQSAARGGKPRSSAARIAKVRVLAKFASRNLSPPAVLMPSGEQTIRRRRLSENQEVVIETGAFRRARKMWATWSWVYSAANRFTWREVAEIADGAEEPAQYVLFEQARFRAKNRWSCFFH